MTKEIDKLEKDTKKKEVKVKNTSNTENDSDTKKTLELMMEQIKGLTEKISSIQEENSEKDEIIKSLKSDKGNHSNTSEKGDSWIRVVNLWDNVQGLQTSFKVGTRTIQLGKIGDSASLRYFEFEELISKHIGMFERGIIAVSDENKDVAISFGVPFVDRPALTEKSLSELYKLSLNELESLYEDLSDGNKDLIVSYWARTYSEGDKNFCDVKKISLLNDMSGGKLNAILEDVKHSNSKE